MALQISKEVNAQAQDMNIFDVIKMQQQLDKMMVLYEFMQIKDVKVNMNGAEHTILSQELLSEYSPKIVKFMVKNETYRKSVQEVFHLKSINDEKLIGWMDNQVVIKMTSHRRKARHEIVNALRNEMSGTEVIPTNTKRRKFLGIA